MAETRGNPRARREYPLSSGGGGDQDDVPKCPVPALHGRSEQPGGPGRVRGGRGSLIRLVSGENSVSHKQCG